MTLSGADFEISEAWANGNVVQGFVDDAAARFTFTDAWAWGGHSDVVEKLPDGTILVITGIAEVVPTERGLAGRLDGSFIIYESSSNCEMRRWCTSALHDFRPTR